MFMFFVKQAFQLSVIFLIRGRVDFVKKSTIITTIIGILCVIAICVAGVVLHNMSKKLTSPAEPLKVSMPFIIHKADSPTSKTVDVFYDYSCPHCVELDRASEKFFSQLMKEKDITLRYTPVTTVGAEWNVIATAAAVNVYNKAPEHFLDFHHGLMEWYHDNIIQTNDFSRAQKIEYAQKAVHDIAKTIGIDPSIVDNLNTAGAKELLKETTEQWVKNVQRQDDNTIGTPEIALNNKKIDFVGNDMDTIIKNLSSTILGEENINKK